MDGPDYSVIDRTGLGGMIFYPRGDGSPTPDGAEDFAFEVAPGVSLGARLYISDPTHPTILYFHGNGEVAGDHDDISGFYRQIETNLFVVEFRGYGRSTGTPSFAALVADGATVAPKVHAALDARGFSANRFAMGRSLGTQPALEVAARTPEGILGLIVESGAGAIRGMLERTGIDVRSGEGAALAEGHEAKVRSIRLPALLIHGERDDLVPLTRAVELHDLLGSEEKELVVLEGVGHNDLLWLRYREYFAALGAFVRRHSGASAT